MWPLSKFKSKASSRRQIRIKEVHDGVLTLPEGLSRVVVETTSVNFELKSEAEQDVLIDSFQSFLQSLPFPIQILIRTSEMNVHQYLERIDQDTAKSGKKYESQREAYKEFVKQLVHGNTILSRHIYIVLPSDEEQKRSDPEVSKQQLLFRRDILMKGLEKMGMKSKQLGSIALLDLFYTFYNPASPATTEVKRTMVHTLLEQTHA